MIYVNYVIFVTYVIVCATKARGKSRDVIMALSEYTYPASRIACSKSAAVRVLVCPQAFKGVHAALACVAATRS